MKPYSTTDDIKAKLYSSSFLQHFQQEDLKQKCLKGYFCLQDGATYHCTTNVLVHLKHMFGKCLIALNTKKKARVGINYHTMSCDLNTFNLLLWFMFRTAPSQ